MLLLTMFAKLLLPLLLLTLFAKLLLPMLLLTMFAKLLLPLLLLTLFAKLLLPMLLLTLLLLSKLSLQLLSLLALLLLATFSVLFALGALVLLPLVVSRVPGQLGFALGLQRAHDVLGQGWEGLGMWRLLSVGRLVGEW